MFTSDKTKNGSDKASGTGTSRPISNLRDYFRLLNRRLAMRRPVEISWLPWLTLCIGLVVPMIWIVDPVYGASRHLISTSAIDIAMVINKAGSSYWMYFTLVPAVLFCICLQFRGIAPRALYSRHAWSVSAAYLLTAIATQEILITILKQMFGRARPIMFDTLGPFHLQPLSFGYQFTSFPSGHSASIGCAAVCLALMFPRFRVILVLLAIWIGSARAVIGAHYPSDIVAGLMFGTWISYATALFFARFGLLFVSRPGRLPEIPAYLHRAMWWPFATPRQSKEKRLART